jgi:hypothetical protein
MEEPHICKYCGVETTQPDDECYAKPAKTMTALEWFLRHVNIGGVKQGHGLSIDEVKEQAIEMFEQQIKSAFIQGDMFSVDYYDGINQTDDNYYNETYKKDTNGTH